MSVYAHPVQQAQGEWMAWYRKTRGLWASEGLDLYSGFAFTSCMTLGKGQTFLRLVFPMPNHTESSGCCDSYTGCHM